MKRLLAERILVIWLQVHDFDSALALAATGAPAVQVRFLEQQLRRSQSRHVAAVKGLADLWRLMP